MGSERQWYFFDLLYLSDMLYISAFSLSILHTHLLPSLHLSSCLSVPLSHSLCPLWKPLSPLALLLSSPSVRLLQAALLPLCLPHVLPLEDMHLGSCCTLLCVLINILAASGRKWVFLSANPLWGGWLEQRKGKMIEEECQARPFLFSLSKVVETSSAKQMSQKYERCTNAEIRDADAYSFFMLRYGFFVQLVHRCVCPPANKH